jgi:hypothetical protein
VRASDPQSLPGDHDASLRRHCPLGPQGLGGGRDDLGAWAVGPAELGSLVRRNGCRERLDDAAVGDDVHQLAVEAEGDGLSGQVVRDLDLPAAEADLEYA